MYHVILVQRSLEHVIFSFLGSVAEKGKAH